MAEILKTHIVESLEILDDDDVDFLDLIYKLVASEGGEKVCTKQTTRGPSRKS